jgi:hypothetical protein
LGILDLAPTFVPTIDPIVGIRRHKLLYEACKCGWKMAMQNEI